MGLKKYHSLIFFILGFGIFIFTRLSKLVPTIPIAILISFIFILRFERTQSPKKGIWLTLLGFILSMNIALFGLFDLGGDLSSLLFNIFRSSFLAILYFLPFMVDRLIYPKLQNKFYSTLVFPIITTAIFFLLTLEGPFEGNIQLGKFIFGTLALKQLLSLFGVFGFVFFTSWISSSINYLWEMKFNFKKTKKFIFIFLLIIISIYLFGAVKINLTSVTDTVKVASVIITPIWGETPIQEIFDNKIIFPFEETIKQIENKIKIAVLNEAKIISFQEILIIINEENQEELRNEYQRLAKENGVYLSITYAYFPEKGKGENKHLLIDNEGKILLDYTKRYLVGFGEYGETGVFVKGPEIIQYVDTPYGRIAVSICRDIEMDKFIIQAGRAGVDIMFNPSYEWPESWVFGNTQSSIANGFSFVRTAYNGMVYMQDYNGRILNYMNFRKADKEIMYAEVPINGRWTLYPYIGKLIGHLSVFGLFALLFIAIKNLLINHKI